MVYIAYLHKEKKSDYGVSFLDFPGCITASKTFDDVERKAAEALSFHIKGMIEDGETVPTPSKIERVLQDPASKGAVPFLVKVRVSRKRAQ